MRSLLGNYPLTAGLLEGLSERIGHRRFAIVGKQDLSRFVARLEAVSRALGHASLATTADIYAHWTPAMQERLAHRMDAVLGG